MALSFVPVENNFVVEAADLLSDKFVVAVVGSAVAVAINFVNNVHSFVVHLFGIVGMVGVVE